MLSDRKSSESLVVTRERDKLKSNPIVISSSLTGRNRDINFRSRNKVRSNVVSPGARSRENMKQLLDAYYTSSLSPSRQEQHRIDM